MEDKTLQMPLTKQWFEMTKSGEKTEDYREITNYWLKRLFGKYVTDPNTGEKIDPYSTISQNSDLIIEKIHPLPFKTNIMTLGYPKKGDTKRILMFEHAGIEIRYGRPRWGAKKGVKYFVIKHGELINPSTK